MAILTDFNGVAVAGVAAAAFRGGIQMEKDIIKHIVISSFRNIHVSLGPKFGDHILLVDSRSWRKDIFEHYKANRKKAKEDSKVDWQLIYDVMDELKKDFEEYFPFYVIRERNCEADDLIAAFVKSLNEPCVIVSKDGDFHQLVGPSIQQYHPGNKAFFEIDDPKQYRIEHIVRAGDDGIPNILSDDDTFVSENKSQLKMTGKRLHILINAVKTECFDLTPEEEKILNISSATLRRNYERNKKLIDLTVPYEPAFKGVKSYHEQKPKQVTPMDTAKYFAANKMVVLMGKINDFYLTNGTKQPTKGLGKFL